MCGLYVSILVVNRVALTSVPVGALIRDVIVSNPMIRSPIDTPGGDNSTETRCHNIKLTLMRARVGNLDPVLMNLLVIFLFQDELAVPSEPTNILAGDAAWQGAKNEETARETT